MIFDCCILLLHSFTILAAHTVTSTSVDTLSSTTYPPPSFIARSTRSTARAYAISFFPMICSAHTDSLLPRTVHPPHTMSATRDNHIPWQLSPLVWVSLDKSPSFDYYGLRLATPLSLLSSSSSS